MPKKTITPIQLPQEQPDNCASCPLCGIIPKGMRKPKSKETHVCIGTMEALSGRGIQVRASKKDIRHPWHRPCDTRWASWMQLPHRTLGVATLSYNTFRIPYEQGLQMQIKFHS